MAAARELALGCWEGGSVPVGAAMPGTMISWSWGEGLERARLASFFSAELVSSVGDGVEASSSSSSNLMSTISGAWLIRRLSATLRLFIHRR